MSDEWRFLKSECVFTYAGQTITFTQFSDVWIFFRNKSHILSKAGVDQFRAWDKTKFEEHLHETFVGVVTDQKIRAFANTWEAQSGVRTRVEYVEEVAGGEAAGGEAAGGEAAGGEAAGGEEKKDDDDFNDIDMSDLAFLQLRF